jgi:hypothetical protein
MKSVLFSLVFVYFSAQAATFEVIGPCSEKPILSSKISIQADETVGQFTVRSLTQASMPFVGSDHGIKSINGTPTGDESLEIISNEEMRAYGWCYKHNGIEPAVYPHEIKMISDDDKILWVYGYSFYSRGKWLTMCEPAWKLKPDFLCKN